MAHKPIREADGKRMMARLLKEYTPRQCTIRDTFVSVGPEVDLENLPAKYPWINNSKLVVKPDQRFKRRGKNNLILLDATWPEASKWIQERMGKPVTIGNVTGILDHFILEPFVPHTANDEYYLSITTSREGDEIMFYHKGGIEIGDVDQKAAKLQVPIGVIPSRQEIESKLVSNIPSQRKPFMACFIEGIYKFYVDLNYTFLEINPFVPMCDHKICDSNCCGFPLDMAAELDDTAEFESGSKWGPIEFPPPFGRSLTKEEAYTEELDSKTGASLKLTVLNPEGRIWTLVAGGGASVIYADTITDLGYMDEMANYGEYSGDPNEEFTYLYAKTVIDLMTRKKNSQGKVLLIGGGIANFTDVAQTFKGIVRALKEYKNQLQETNTKIFVRRGGPNYKEGLSVMRELGKELGVPIEVYGPETHMTKIVAMAVKEVN
ncbi:MAG TPA: ATP citrate lyase citrate-binding domain-containing protein [Candidatus Bathyarchaeia archaeon]|nr:ATP citrate lyase citrate-binding domain-containing protein [Candidatus Bathyarchaeia archaeon]